MRALLLLAVLAAPLRGQSPEQLFQERRYDEARAAFLAQLARNRGDANAMYHLGRIAVAQQKTGEAIDWFEKAVDRDDRNALYHFWLASAVGDEAQRASKLRQPFLARRVKREFERAVELDPTMLDARFGLLDFYSVAPGMMGGSMDKAREQASEIAKLNGMRGHLAKARLALRQKDDAGAIKEYEAAIALAPDSTPAYYGLASLHRSRSRWSDAMSVYDRLIKARPDETVAHALWGIVSAIGGLQMDRGERELRFFLANAPKETPAQSYSNVHYRLGQILEKTGRKESARSEYLEAVKRNPKNEDAKKALDGLK